MRGSCGLAAAVFLFGPAFFAADRVHRPGVSWIRLQPAVRNQIVQFVAGHRNASLRLGERLAIPLIRQSREHVPQD